MSRIGKKPVPVPANVTATITGQTVKFKGPKGELEFTLPDKVRASQSENGIEVSPVDDSKQARAMWGMSRTTLANLVKGVTEGYSHTLEIQGVGFRAQLKGKDQLQLTVGFSHDIVHKIPPGVDVAVSGARQEVITVSGIDKQLVGQVAAEIRSYRPPEPYQGKGIRHQGEFVFRKEGKKK
ncbi:MAG TPA: 50S ribosomal protein L6 [Hyphomicrobiaceae bacterium]|jgi:large subunit ribosomal protein L6